jgi:hypothetical protein
MRQSLWDPVWRPGSGAAGGGVCVRVGAVGVCGCERPEGVREKASTA